MKVELVDGGEISFDQLDNATIEGHEGLSWECNGDPDRPEWTAVVNGKVVTATPSVMEITIADAEEKEDFTPKTSIPSVPKQNQREISNASKVLTRDDKDTYEVHLTGDRLHFNIITHPEVTLDKKWKQAPKTKTYALKPSQNDYKKHIAALIEPFKKQKGIDAILVHYQGDKKETVLKFYKYKG